uniref:leucine--tRNA ligase n=1 Tax=Trichuris muris TaxID=70415 RepID=A0A5S6Q9J2_TRIMR
MRFRLRLPACNHTLSRVYSTALQWPGLENGQKLLAHEDFEAIENRWHMEVLYSCKNVPADAAKQYVLPMFPYPSGNLHIGHLRVYTISDILARFYRLKDCKVIHPIGWDAFGLPADNAAKERKENPAKWTAKNIVSMKSQLLQLGCQFDWNREIRTCNPDYYKWTQWIFLQLLKVGLVYRHESFVNWDPVDLTVLATEQVNEHGCSWRSGARVVQKRLKQWFVKTSYFAEELYNELDKYTHWADIASIQRHWIGPCDSYRFSFKLQKDSGIDFDDFVHIHADKPSDLIYGRLIIVRRQHILNVQGLSQVGDSLLAVTAWNPITQRSLPIFVADDSCFIDSEDARLVSFNDPYCQTFAQKHLLSQPDAALEKLTDAEILDLAKIHGCGGYKTSRKLKDWVVSRQRYWGTPIPIVYCSNCGAVPVPENELPVTLPDVIDDRVYKKSFSLAEFTNWRSVKCPKCFGQAERETDTLDTFFDSSWYYLRFLDSRNASFLCDTNLANANMPVDIYIGGKEHAALHLFYARFMSRFLSSIGTHRCPEPFARLLPQGMVMAPTYKTAESGKYVSSSSVVTSCGKLYDKETGEPLLETMEKMSKSKQNGVDPQELFAKYGCDVTRLLVTANVSPQSHRSWNLDGLRGIQNWINRVCWVVATVVERRRSTEACEAEAIDATTEAHLKESSDYFIRQVTYHMEKSFLFNTAISRLQGFTNVLRKCAVETVAGSPEFERCLRSLLIMMHPFAPHVSSEFWDALSEVPTLLRGVHSAKRLPVWEQKWPAPDKNSAAVLVVQLNGRRVAKIRINSEAFHSLDGKSALEMAMECSSVKAQISQKRLRSYRLELSPELGGRLLLQVV